MRLNSLLHAGTLSCSLCGINLVCVYKLIKLNQCMCLWIDQA